MNATSLTPNTKFDLLVRSAILKGEKPAKGVEAQLAPNENQMHRLTAYLDGQPVVVAQRHGRGGMDFNKLLGGKVFAVAADGISPVFEKDGAGKATKVQKQEDGKPLYSSSGFYLLSSKDYPAVQMVEGYTRLFADGEKVWLITPEQVAAKQTVMLASDMDLEMALMSVVAALGDDQNCVSTYDAQVNKRRKRDIEAAKNVAEDNGEAYDGVEFRELEVSEKDGKAFVILAWQIEGEGKEFGILMREYQDVDDADRPVTKYDDAESAVARFTSSDDSERIAAALAQGKPVTFSIVQGHVLRTSVSFRRKVENVLAAAKANPDKPAYGDAVYIQGALNGWVKGLVAVMQSMHPNFPSKDYDAHYYVAACRQAEVGMNRRDGGWSAPQALSYDLPATLV